jgi:hypothetical protein
LKVFFDNCTSPTLAATLNGFVQHLGHAAIHIKDLPCGRHAADLAWIDHLAQSGDDWLVMTGDGRIQKNRAERFAFRQAGLKGLVFAPAFQKIAMNQRASFLLWRWPDIEGIARLTAAPFLFELPANRSSRLRPLPL